MGRFNIRVYGLVVNEEELEILVCEEMIGGKKVIKFPGGGLEFGEGTIDCLKREFLEELNAEIYVIDHFYTTDFYQPSAWDGSQVISVYYFIHLTTKIEFPYNNGNEKCFFCPLESLNEMLSLPIDVIVAQKLRNKFKERKC